MRPSSIQRKSITDLSGTTNEASMKKSSFPAVIKYYDVIDQYAKQFANKHIFFGLPEHYTMRKKLVALKKFSKAGYYWNLLCTMLSLLTSIMCIIETYFPTYDGQKIYRKVDESVIFFFCVDFLFNLIICDSFTHFFLKFMTWVDIITTFPVATQVLIYLILQVDTSALKKVNLSIFRFARLLRLFHIIQPSPSQQAGQNDGIKQQALKVSVTVVCLIFMAAAVFFLMENEIKHLLFFSCNYSNEYTSWIASCSEHILANDPASCDCKLQNCVSTYGRYDEFGHPSIVQCQQIPFLNCIYYIVVTIATIGYGDIHATYTLSRMVVIVVIFVSIVIIPIQLNTLSSLVSAHSVYLESFKLPPDCDHVLICGAINDCSKLERFCKEFFSPYSTKQYEGQGIIIVILSPNQPSEELKKLFTSALVNKKIKYLIGTVLNNRDLKRARAHEAVAAFIFCDVRASKSKATADDMTAILRSISLESYNNNLESIVQVVKPEERDTLQVNGVDVVLCFNTFSNAIIARNSFCPGFSTLIELLFTNISYCPQAAHNRWLKEYAEGAKHELYYIPIAKVLEAFGYQWTLVVQALFLKFGVITIGLCNEKFSSLVMNPTPLEIDERPADYFQTYSVAIVLSSCRAKVNSIGLHVRSKNDILALLEKVHESEKLHKLRGQVVTKYSHQLRNFNENESETNIEEWNVKDLDDNLASSGDDENHSTPPKRKRNSFKTGYRSEKGSPQADISSIKSMKDLHAQKKELIIGSLKMTHLHVKPTIAADLNSKIESIKNAYSDVSNSKSWARIPEVDMLLAIQSSSNESAVRHKRELDNASGITDHIIFLGCTDSFLTIVQELRNPLMVDKYFHPIVFVGENLPEDWYKVADFEQVYFIRSKLNKDAMSRLNIDEAYSVTLLDMRNDSAIVLSEENLDADVSFLYLKLESYIPQHVFFCVEMTSLSNLNIVNAKMLRSIATNKSYSVKGPNKYLFESTRRGEIAYRAVEVERMFLDRGLSFFEIALKATGITHEEDFWDISHSHVALPAFAAGKTVSPFLFDALASKCFYSTLAPLVAEALISGQTYQSTIPSYIPANLVGCTFEQLFQIFIVRHVLVIAVYRSSSTEKNVLPYVFVAPNKDTIINKNDKLFVYANSEVLFRAIETITAFGSAILDSNCKACDIEIDNLFSLFKNTDNTNLDYQSSNGDNSEDFNAELANKNNAINPPAHYWV